MTTQIGARWAKLDPNTMEANGSDQFSAKLDPAGGLEAGAAGIKMTRDKVTYRGSLDPSGATIALPVVGDAVDTGYALGVGDEFLIESDGTVGGIPVKAGDILVVNGATLPPVADSDFFHIQAGGDVTGYLTKAEVFTLTAGQITGGVTLANAPSTPTDTTVSIAGAPSQAYTEFFTVAGSTVTFTAAAQALLIAGDIATVQYSY